jgi:tetratricopeptide (TPR) repeat protein
MAEEAYLKGDFNAAIAYYEQALEDYLPPDQVAEGYYRIGLAMLKLGRSADALDKLKFALMKVRDNILRLRIYEALAYGYNMQGRYPDALARLEAIQAAVPAQRRAAVFPHELLYQLGVTYIKCLNWTKGRQILGTLLERYSQTDRAQAARIILSLPSDAFYPKFGTFRQRSNALRLAGELRGRGVSVSLHEVQGADSRPLYLLLGSGYAVRSEAQREVRRLRSIGIRAIVVP